jgi:hypothetical protein
MLNVKEAMQLLHIPEVSRVFERVYKQFVNVGWGVAFADVIIL